jgi:hypothetical protein
MQFVNFDIVSYASTLATRKPYEAKDIDKARNELAVHIDGLPLEKLNSIKYPKESVEQQAWRNAIYQPITKAMFSEAISGLQRIFNAGKGVIEATDAVKPYLELPLFSGFTFEAWYRHIVPSYMIADPNALFVVLPTGAGLVDPNSPVVPIVKIYGSEQIHDKGDDYVTIRLHGEKGKPELLLVLTANEVFRLRRKDSKTFVIDETYYYPHLFGEVPAWYLGGIYLPKKEIYESYLASAVPSANSYAIEFNKYQAITGLYAHPTPVVREITCRADDCNNGWVYGSSPDDKHRCGSCKGTGKINIFNQELSHLEIPEGVDLDVNNILQYISPPIAILEHIKTTIDSLKTDLKRALLINYVEEAQSGVAKAIDRSKEYDFLSEVASNIYNRIIYTTLWAFERYLVPSVSEDKRQKPTVQAPTSFALETDGEILLEIQSLRQSNAPDSAIRKAYLGYIAKQYAGDTLFIDKAHFLAQYDALYSKTTADINLLFAAGKIDVLTFYRNLYGATELDKYMNENPTSSLASDNYAALGLIIDERIAAYVIKPRR